MEGTTSSVPPNPLVISKCSGDDASGEGSGAIFAQPTSIRQRRKVSSSSFSVGGIYRRKHTLRAVFRSASLVVLLGGWALYYHLYGDSNFTTDVALRQGNRTGTDLKGLFTLRKLKGDETEIDPEMFTRQLTEQSTSDCPPKSPADPVWFSLWYAIGMIYMFLALAIVCDEFFVPALEEMSNEQHLNLSMDVAGATLMAAGGSAPELFTSFVGTFKQTDIGIGTIVGSAVFNVLFVIGMCSLLSKDVLTLTWWPLFRDSSYYALGLVVLSLLVGVFTSGKVVWWEAVILLCMYFGYVLLMYYNRKLYTFLTGKELALDSELDDGAAGEESETPSVTTPNGLTNSSLIAVAGTEDEKKGENGGSGGTRAPMSSALSRAVVTRETTIRTRETLGHNDFRRPATFRAGVLKLLLHPESAAEQAGIGIVAKIQGDVGHVFKQIDLNGDGSIDKEELAKMFEMLGHEIAEQELDEVFASLDLDGDGEISEEEFSKWYMKSEQRVLSKIKPIFDQFDADKSGTLDRGEVSRLLRTIEPVVTEADVDEALGAMYKSGSKEEITYEEFTGWYIHSIIYTRQQSRIEKQFEEDAQGVCDALKPPWGEGVAAWFKYLLVFPLVAVLTITVPDVRRPGLAKWCYLSFVLSIIWIGVFSFFMVQWAEVLGDTMGIPSVVMGYTFLAAGTSVPDLLSSVIVARMGEGDMAVSSSIGSNIFDILVGLPLPWLVFLLYPNDHDEVIIKAEGIFISIFILVGMLVAIIAIVHCQGWKMTRTLGGLMFVLYFAFLVQAITLEWKNNPCFG